jgi:hypothetical protein
MSYNLANIIPQGHQNFGANMDSAMSSMWNVNQANQQASLANKALGGGQGGGQNQGIPPMQPYNMQQGGNRQVRAVGGDLVPVGYNQSHWGGGSGGPFGQTMGFNLADDNQRPMYEQSMNAMRAQRQQDMNMQLNNQRQKLQMMWPLLSQMFGMGMGGMGGGGGMRGAQYNTNFGANGSAY